MQPVYTVIKRRADFLAAAKSGCKFVKPSLVAQARRREAHEISPSPIRVGMTATKTLGNAVVRARVKRRLRAAASTLMTEHGVAGCDYVFIGREQAFKGTYDNLILDMKHALKRLAQQLNQNQAPDA